MSTAVVAIAVNPALEEAIQTFRQAMRHDGKAAVAYVELMARTTDRIIGLMLLEPVVIADISPTQRRIVDFAVETGNKASALLTAQIYGKMSNAQLLPVARELEKRYWPAGADNDDVPQLYYAADTMFARNYRLALDSSLAGTGRSQLALVLQVMDHMVDDILQQFFLEQTKHADMGFITRKALDVSVAATRAACHAVLHKVVKDFSDIQLQAFMAGYRQALRQKG